jgi:hypothetical protein
VAAGPGRISARTRRVDTSLGRGIAKRCLANLTEHNLDQLTPPAKTRLKRMQYRPGLIDVLIAKTGLDLRPP